MILVVAHGWQRHKAGEQMAELLREVKEFGDRVQTFFGHVQKIGKAVDDAGKAFNQAVASHRSRLAPQAAKLEHLSAGWNETAELKPVENRPLLEGGEARGEAAGAGE
jgi:DNA recombination protein RmuC